MKIALLLQREPFFTILEQTLKAFFEQRYQAGHQVSWHPRGQRSQPRAQVWLANRHLNVLFVGAAQEQVFAPIEREFSRSLTRWRRWLQPIYLRLATRLPTSSWLADGRLQVTPAVAGAEAMLLIAGNQRIRLLDFSRGRCFVLGKQGFPTAPMRAEIAVRSAFPALPSPQLYEWADDQSWFCEELVVGTPLNRLPDSIDREAVRERVFQALAELERATRETVPVTSYLANLESQLFPALANPLWKNSEREALEAAARWLLARIQAEGGEVCLALSHGDLQPGNILCAGDRTWLIDWEQARQRQRRYDTLVWSLQARRRGWGRRLQQLLRGPGASVEQEKACATKLNDTAEPMAFRDLLLFLLEELTQRLLENDNRCFFAPDPSWPGFRDDFFCACKALGDKPDG